MASFYSQPTHWLRLRVDLLLGLCSDMEPQQRIRSQCELTTKLLVCVLCVVCVVCILCPSQERLKGRFRNKLWKQNDNIISRGCFCFSACELSSALFVKLAVEKVFQTSRLTQIKGGYIICFSTDVPPLPPPQAAILILPLPAPKHMLFMHFKSLPL